MGKKLDVQVIGNSDEYRDGWERIWGGCSQRESTQDDWERPNGGRGYVKREMGGGHPMLGCPYPVGVVSNWGS